VGLWCMCELGVCFAVMSGGGCLVGGGRGCGGGGGGGGGVRGISAYATSSTSILCIQTCSPIICIVCVSLLTGGGGGRGVRGISAYATSLRVE